MRVLVAGGAGFIGSHICSELIDRGDEVLCVDNCFTGSKQNIAHLMPNPKFEFIRHDITFPLFVEVDQIMNFACPASPIHYKHDPVQTVKTNVVGMINLLGLAKRLKCRILQASTSEVYGDPEVNPQPESYVGHVNPIGPRACYDEGKRCAETLCYDYVRQHDLDVRVVRIFNTYGPRTAEADGRVVSNFVVNALRGIPLEIHGSGMQTRSFQYIDDLVRGIMLLMDRPGRVDGPVNMGNPVEMPVLDLARRVLEILNIPSDKNSGMIYFAPRTADDPEKRKPDISLAKELLGWEPLVSLDEGLEKTIRYFQHKGV